MVRIGGRLGILFFWGQLFLIKANENGSFYGNDEYFRPENYIHTTITRNKVEPLEPFSKLVHWKKCQQREYPAPKKENQKKRQIKEYQSYLNGRSGHIQLNNINEAHGERNGEESGSAAGWLAAFALFASTIVEMSLFFLAVIPVCLLVFRILFYTIIYKGIVNCMRRSGRWIYVKWGLYKIRLAKETKPYWMKGSPTVHFSLPGFFRKPGETEVPEELAQKKDEFEERFSEDELSSKDELSDQLKLFDVYSEEDKNEDTASSADEFDDYYDNPKGRGPDDILYRQPHVDEEVLGKSRVTRSYLPCGIWIDDIDRSVSNSDEDFEKSPMNDQSWKPGKKKTSFQK